jgi:hypothetical protein
MNGENQLLNLSGVTLEQIIWDEEILHLYFKRTMHLVVSSGHVLPIQLIKDVRTVWINQNLDSRITDFLVTLKGKLCM